MYKSVDGLLEYTLNDIHIEQKQDAFFSFSYLGMHINPTHVSVLRPWS